MSSSHPSPYSALGNEICALVDAGALEPVAAWFAAHPTCGVNAHNARYQSPLMVAAQAPLSLPVLRHLLSIGASPHYTVGSELGMTALHLAAGASNVHGVALLLAAGADPLRLDSVGRSPLHCAAIAGSNAVVRRLLRAILHRVTVVALAWDERGGLGAGPPGHPGMGLSGSGVGEWPPAGSSSSGSSSSSSSSVGSAATAATAPSAPAAPGPSAAALMSSLTVISRSIAASGESLESVLSALAAGGALAPAGSAPSAFTVAGARAPGSGASSSSSSSSAALAAAARLPPTPAQRALAMTDLRVAVAESVTAFLNGQDDSGYTSLMLAAEHGREDVVKTLLAAGCDVLARNKLCHTAIGVRVLPACRPFPVLRAHARAHTHRPPPRHPPPRPSYISSWRTGLASRASWRCWRPACLLALAPL